LTIEGELDDISGAGQTQAAHDLCTGIRPKKQHEHFTAPKCGHYGIFSGRRWREIICPMIGEFILFFFQKFSTAFTSPATHTLGAWVIVVPVIGGLIIGLIARYGTEAIRGHGIPEAIEAILFKKSTMSPKVALLKPLASASRSAAAARSAPRVRSS
jgi:hypothetical protein